jgi:hypothetical protein
VGRDASDGCAEGALTLTVQHRSAQSSARGRSRRRLVPAGPRTLANPTDTQCADRRRERRPTVCESAV